MKFFIVRFSAHLIHMMLESQPSHCVIVEDAQMSCLYVQQQ